MTGRRPFSSAVVPRCDRGMNDSEERSDEEPQRNNVILRFALNDKYRHINWLSAGPGRIPPLPPTFGIISRP